MKKAVFLTIFVVVFGLINLQAGSFSLTLGAGIRNINEDLYKDVYDSSPMVYSVDLAFQVTNHLHLFLHTDYLSVDGETTLTGDPTTLTITPLEFGGRFIFGKRLVFPYIGLGAGYYMYKEENVIGMVDEKKLGFFAEGGMQFKITPSIFIDLKLKNVFLKDDGTHGDIDLGGLGYMGGLGITF